MNIALVDQNGACYCRRKRYFHYQGRFHTEGDSVVHEASESLNPKIAGTRHVRRVTFEQDQLVLSAEDAQPGSSVRRTHRIYWARPGDAVLSL